MTDEKFKTIDLDQLWEEHRESHSPIQVKIGDKTFELPDSIPARLFFFIQRHCIQKEDGERIIAVPDDRMSEFLEKMFGAEIIEHIANSHVTHEFMFTKVVPAVMEQWGHGITEADMQAALEKLTPQDKS